MFADDMILNRENPQECTKKTNKQGHQICRMQDQYTKNINWTYNILKNVFLARGLNECKAVFTVLGTWGRKQEGWGHVVEETVVFPSEHSCIVRTFYEEYAFMDYLCGKNISNWSPPLNFLKCSKETSLALIQIMIGMSFLKCIFINLQCIIQKWN